MMDLETLCSGKYVSLTTYRADGTGVATPVWLAREGDAIVIITKAGSGKIKRLRHDPRVSLAPCDARGRVTGPSAEGMAKLLDEARTSRVAELIDHQYGLMGRVMQWFSDRRIDDADGGHVGISVTLDPTD